MLPLFKRRRNGRVERGATIGAPRASRGGRTARCAETEMAGRDEQWLYAGELQLVSVDDVKPQGQERSIGW